MPATPRPKRSHVSSIAPRGAGAPIATGSAMAPANSIHFATTTTTVATPNFRRSSAPGRVPAMALSRHPPLMCSVSTMRLATSANCNGVRNASAMAIPMRCPAHAVSGLAWNAAALSPAKRLMLAKRTIPTVMSRLSHTILVRLSLANSTIMRLPPRRWSSR